MKKTKDSHLDGQNSDKCETNLNPTSNDSIENDIVVDFHHLKNISNDVRAALVNHFPYLCANSDIKKEDDKYLLQLRNDPNSGITGVYPPDGSSQRIKCVFARQLKNIRAANYPDRKSFADALGCTYNTIFYWERARSAPSIQTITDICYLTQTSPNKLFGYKDDTSSLMYNEDMSKTVAGNVIDIMQKAPKEVQEPVLEFLQKMPSDNELFMKTILKIVNATGDKRDGALELINKLL